MIFKKEQWSEPIILEVSKPLIIVMRNINQLYLYQRELLIQSDKKEGTFRIVHNDKELKFDSEIEIIPNILTIDFNTTKLINNLYTKISKETSASDTWLVFEDLRKKLLEYLVDIRKETLINFSINETKFELNDLLKTFEVRYNQKENTPLEALQKYLDLLKEVLKMKVAIISFTHYLFKKEEIEHLINYAISNNIYLIFLEKEKLANFNEICSIIYIEDDELIY